MPNLDQFSVAFKLILGALSALAPLLNRFRKLKVLQFGQSLFFNFLSQIVSITIFFTVLRYRNYLHFILDFWWWWIISIAALLISFALAMKARAQPSKLLIVLGSILYILSIGTFVLGITQLASEEFVYKRLSGTVQYLRGSIATRIPVYLVGSDLGEIYESKTNRFGKFQFLLEPKEAGNVTEVRVKVNVQDGSNWKYIDWDPSGEDDYEVGTITIP